MRKMNTALGLLGVLFLLIGFITVARAENGALQPHPRGCPSRAFCGCGVMKYLGLSDRSLWLAREWLRFPRAVAGAGMVAVFGHHHVAAIITTHGDGTATLYDPNSGHHATRIHRRDIRHAAIVNPRG